MITLDRELWQLYFQLNIAIKTCEQTVELLFEFHGNESDELFFKVCAVLSQMKVKLEELKNDIGFYEPSYYSLN